MLSFVQLNLHKAEQASVLLGQGLQDRSRCISLMTEPFTVQHCITNMPKGVKLIYAKSTSASLRAAILASKDLTITALDSHCNRDCAAGITTVGIAASF